MLVFPDGSQRGTLGGGCVEAEVKQKALAVLQTSNAPAELLSFCLDEKGTGCTEAIATDERCGAPVGARYLFDEAGRLAAQLGNGTVPEPVSRNLMPLRERPSAALRQGIAYLPVLPRITLLIVGGG